MKKLILTVFLSLTLFSNAYAATFYFSELEGNNTTGAGTAGSPWQRVAGKKDGLDALSPGDICLLKAGEERFAQNSVLAINSSGTLGNPIVFGRYGSGTNPKLNGSSVTANWTLHSVNIWKKTGQFTTTYTIGVDGTHALSRSDKTNTTLNAGEFLNESGTVYIRLFDSSDPNGHTIYVPTFNTDGASTNYYGIIRGVAGRGAYLEFNNLDVLYAPGRGVQIVGVGNRFNDGTVIGSGKDGILTELGGTNFRTYRTEVKYCSAGGNGYGQAVTFNTSDNHIINGNVHDNFMEGVDFLDWSTTGLSDASYSSATYTTVKDNSRWLGVSGTWSAHGVYIDGAHDIVIENCEISGHGNTTGKASNADCGGILIGSEHAANVATNVWVRNNLIYNNKRFGVNSYNAARENTITGVYIESNTIIGYQNNSADRAASDIEFRDFSTTADGWVVRNNILVAASNSSPKCFMNIEGDAITGTFLDSNNNLFYRESSTTIVYPGSYTLATWQTASGEDASSVQADPKLVTLSDTPDAHIWHTGLQASDSPAVNAGTTLSTMPAWFTALDILADDGLVVGSTRSDGVADSGTLDIGYHYYTPTPSGNLTSASVTPATLYLNTTNTDTILLTTANAWPLNGTLVVTYPTSLGGGFTFDSTGASVATFNSGGSGSLAVSRVGSVITLTRSGGSEIAASTAVSISLTNVLNPPQAGSTGAYQIKTTTSAGTTIDIDTNVSASQIITPPASFVTTRCGGISFRNIKFNKS